MLESTEGLPGPVIVNRLGNPAVIRPSKLRGPSAHFCASGIPPRPLMPALSSEPVIASKPVAYTMLSSAYSASRVAMPSGVTLVIGEARKSTSVTLGRLNVS